MCRTKTQFFPFSSSFHFPFAQFYLFRCPFLGYFFDLRKWISVHLISDTNDDWLLLEHEAKHWRRTWMYDCESYGIWAIFRFRIFAWWKTERCLWFPWCPMAGHKEKLKCNKLFSANALWFTFVGHTCCICSILNVVVDETMFSSSSFYNWIFYRLGHKIVKSAVLFGLPPPPLHLEGPFSIAFSLTQLNIEFKCAYQPITYRRVHK